MEYQVIDSCMPSWCRSEKEAPVLWTSVLITVAIRFASDVTPASKRSADA